MGLRTHSPGFLTSRVAGRHSIFFNPFQFHRVTVSLKLSKCLRPPKRKTSTNLNQQLSNRASHRIRILLSEQEHRFFVTYCLYRLTLHLMVNSHQHFIGFLQDSSLYLQTSIMDISLAKVNWALQATNTQAAWNMIEALSKQSTITQLPLSKNWIFSEMIISAGQHEDATVLENIGIRPECTLSRHGLEGRLDVNVQCIYKHAGQLTQKHAKGNYCFGRIESSNYLFLPQLLWAIPMRSQTLENEIGSEHMKRFQSNAKRLPHFHKPKDHTALHFQ